MGIMRSRRTRLAVVGAMAGAALVLTSCSGSESGNAQTADSPSDSSASTTVAGQVGDDTGGSTEFAAEIGDCVTLGGTMMAAEIEQATCGSMESNYRVVSKAPANAQCPSDSDQSYYETLGGTEQGAICLDIDWVIGGCMSVPVSGEPTRVECTDPAATDVVRAVEIVSDSDGADSCSTGLGYEHPERRFTVCVEEI